MNFETFQLFLYNVGKLVNTKAVQLPKPTLIKKTYFRTILTNCSFCSLEALGEGKPSWWTACCSQRQRLSQCFLFMASKISDKCSSTDLGESPPE